MAEERFHMMALGIVAAIVITASALYLADGTGIAVTGMATRVVADMDTYLVQYSHPDHDKAKFARDNHNKIWERDEYGSWEPTTYTDLDSALAASSPLKEHPSGDSTTDKPKDDYPMEDADVPGSGQAEKTFNLKAQNVLSNVNNALQFGQGMWMLMGKSFREQKLFEVMGEIGEMLSARFWISEVCMGAFADVETGSGSGMLLGEVGGLPIPVVNVKGEKVPMQSPDPEDPSEIVTRYYYKIEWWATYPSGSRLSDHDAIRFDIYVFGPELHARINPDTIEVREGEERSATGTNMRYEGPTFKQYDSICLIFHHPIEDYDGKDLHRICDTFGVYGGDPTSVAVPEAAAAGAGSFDSGAFTD